MASLEPAKLRRYFEFFELDVDATIDDLDEQYGYLSQELHRGRKSRPDDLDKQQQEIDAKYYALLQHLIQQDCASGQRTRRPNWSWDNIITRRYEPGVSRFTKDPRTVTKKPSINKISVGDEETRRACRRATSWQQGKRNGKSRDRSKVSRNRRSSNAERSVPTPRVCPPFGIVESTGDIFDAPNEAVIVHAVNCLGVWGRGFAAALKSRYPGAFSEYKEICTSFDAERLAGHCLLIPPQPADYQQAIFRRRHWIACLFTSVGYGSRKDLPHNAGRDDKTTILTYTDSALVDLRCYVEKARSQGLDIKSDKLFSPKFNAGSFQVPWEHTRRLIEACFSDYGGAWNIVSLPTNKN